MFLPRTFVSCFFPYLFYSLYIFIFLYFSLLLKKKKKNNIIYKGKKGKKGKIDILFRSEL